MRSLLLIPACCLVLCGKASTTEALLPGVNDAPVLDITKSPALAPVLQGAGAPAGAVGSLVSMLVDYAAPTGQVDNVTDQDLQEGEGASGLGIAIIAADATNGTWHFSINGGTTWTALGTPSASNARLLAADASTRLYFQPNAAFSGTVASGLTIRAWDQSTGSNGNTVNIASTGSTTAFSTATDVVSINVVGAPSFRSSAQAGADVGVLALTVNKPTGTLAGDLLLAAIAIAPSSATITAPAGWNLVRRTNNVTASTITLAEYYKLAGASEPVNYTWSFSASNGSAGGIMAWVNVDPNAPINAESGSTTVSSLSHTAPSISPTASNTKLVTWHEYASSGTWTPPPGMTESVDVFSAVVTGTGGVSLNGNWQALASTGATGTRTATAIISADVGNAAALAIRSLNSAPVLDATRSPALVSVTEDGAPPVGAVGTLVSSLVDFASPSGQVDNVSDADADALLGIAVVDANATNGTWSYSTDGGTNWNSLSGVTGSNARLLAADASTRVYFQPNANYNGVLADALTFRAWDRTTGTNGGTASTVASGGTTAFSAFTDGASLTVNAVNDAPTATNLNVAEAYTEDTPLNLVDIVVADIDNMALTATLTLSTAAAGSLSTGTSGAVTSTFSAGIWTASGAIADVNTLLAGVTFIPTLNFNANFTITTSMSDGALSVNGSKALTGAAVNDAPTATNLSAGETYTEDTPLNLVDIVAADVDNANLTATLTLSSPAAGSLSTGTSGAVTSTYNAGSGIWSASGPIANVNTLLAGVVFMPALNFNANVTIATSVSDGALSANGSKALTGTPVNDAPVLDASASPALNAINEDSGAPVGAAGTPILSLVDFATPVGGLDNVTDVDASPLLGIAVVAADATNGTWWYSMNGGSSWNLLGAPSNASARSLAANASNRLYFQPDGNFSGSSSITFRAWDQTTGADGGTADASVSGGTSAFSASTDVASIAVLPVNDAPQATNLNAGESYATNTPLDLIDIVVSDVDNTTTSVFLSLSNTLAGSLNTGTSGTVTSTWNGGTGVWSASGAIADVNALLAGLTFTPATYFTSDFTIAVQVTDGIAAPLSGSKLMTGPGAPVIAINVHVVLEGSYNASTGLMNGAMRAAGLVPLTEPYTALGYSYVGSTGGTTTPAVLAVGGADAVHDWVIVELRSAADPAAIVYSRAALIQRDGQVCDFDGVSPVTFNVSPGSYYVAVRHRNHLGAMTAAAIGYTATTSFLDLAAIGFPCYGTEAQKTITGSFPVQALWAGDVSFNGTVKYTGSGNDRDPILVTVGSTTPNNTATVYSTSDVNLDGVVKYTGSGNDRDPILVNVGSTTPNNIRVQQLP